MYCEIAEKADQLLQAEVKTRMVEAVAQCKQIEQVLIEFANADSIDDKLDCHDKFLKALHDYFKVKNEAETKVFYNTYQVHQVDADHHKIVARD